MAAEDTSAICGEIFQHLTPSFTSCTLACTHPSGHRPDSPHRCAGEHEWYIDTTAFKSHAE